MGGKLRFGKTLEGIFNQRGALSILSIPLFECVQEDIHTWKFPSYGVKSVYYYILENMVDNREFRMESNLLKIWGFKIYQS
jgi:hypothetical protein